MPLFSIIIPTYNREDLVGKTVETILQQRFLDFEVIVIDDGSTDNTAEIFKSINDPRIAYHKKNNGERGAARNYGARMATGQYINFFDSDDLACPNHLEVASRFILEQGHPEVFHTNYDVRNPDGSKVGEGRIYTSNFDRELMINNFFSCNNIFIRRDICLQHPFEENRRMAVAEDWALWLTLSSRYKIHMLPVVTSAIIMHEQRSIRDWDADRIAERERLLANYVKKDDRVCEKYHSYLPGFFARRHVFASLIYAVKKDKVKAAAYLKAAVRVHPSIIFSKSFLAVVKKIVID